MVDQTGLGALAVAAVKDNADQARYNRPMPSAHSPISESPWFWACLFALMGMVALWAMGPKYGDRQLLEERKAQGRMRAAEQASGGEMTTEVSTAGDLRIPLRPLYAILSAVVIVAWGLLWWSHVRPRTFGAGDTVKDDPPNTSNQRPSPHRA